MQKELLELSKHVGQLLTNSHLTVATAESCTGGLLGHVLTGVAGSSEYYLGGVIAYSNQAKETLLGVDHYTLLAFGAVSEQTAVEMAVGARGSFDSSIGLATTGIAGPGGGTPAKPVGLVYIGISTDEITEAYECHFKGGREEIKESTVKLLLEKLIQQLE